MKIDLHVHRTWFLAGVLFAVGTGNVMLTGCSTASSGYIMHSRSMEPTIPAGAKLSINTDAYKTAQPRRNEFVAFRPSLIARDVFVFRVVALPGEHVALTSAGLWVNGKQQVHPEGLKYSAGTRDEIDLTLKADEYFILGDNTEIALDSRFLGPAHKLNILGKVVGHAK